MNMARMHDVKAPMAMHHHPPRSGGGLTKIQQLPARADFVIPSHALQCISTGKAVQRESLSDVIAIIPVPFVCSVTFSYSFFQFRKLLRLTWAENKLACVSK
jgi:hypothetical protein